MKHPFKSLMPVVFLLCMATPGHTNKCSTLDTENFNSSCMPPPNDRGSCDITSTTKCINNRVSLTCGSTGDFMKIPNEETNQSKCKDIDDPKWTCTETDLQDCYTEVYKRCIESDIEICSLTGSITIGPSGIGIGGSIGTQEIVKDCKEVRVGKSIIAGSRTKANAQYNP